MSVLILLLQILKVSLFVAMKLWAPLLLFGADAASTRGKEEVAAQCEAAKTVYPNCGCSDIYWKGAKQSRVLFQNDNAATFMISIPDDAAAWKFRDENAANFDPNYSIFLQFARHKCGVSFIDAVANGDVQFHFMDQYAGKRLVKFKGRPHKLHSSTYGVKTNPKQGFHNV